MAKRVAGLGRGLEALLPSADINSQLQKIKKANTVGSTNTSELEAEQIGTHIQELPLSAIRPASEQPRKHFDELTIRELAQSIFEHGLLQPILVMPLAASEFSDDGAKYRVLAGERRFRACQILQWPKLPAIVKTVSEVERFELALVENIQREDLTPIDEALAYEYLLRISGLSQNEMAKRLGKERSSLANSLRLLQLPPKVQEGLSQGIIRSGHAKALLMLKEWSESLLDAYALCVGEAWTVRAVERHCQQVLSQLSNAANVETASKSLPKETRETRETIVVETLEDPHKQLQHIEPKSLEFKKEQSQPQFEEEGELVKDGGPSVSQLPRQNRAEINHIEINEAGIIEPKQSQAIIPIQEKESKYWGAGGMLFKEEQLESHLAKVMSLSLPLRLQLRLEVDSEVNSQTNNTVQDGRIVVHRPRKALLQVEFENEEQWELWLNQLGLNQVLDST